MFDFDKFINQPCIAIFGKNITYIPANSSFNSFEIKGDFHRDYKEIKTDSSTPSVSSYEIVLFVRDVDMPQNYPKANQGDFIIAENLHYQIIDIQPHLPGSKKLILHESSKSSN
jgi:hypothetical protein